MLSLTTNSFQKAETNCKSSTPAKRPIEYIKFSLGKPNPEAVLVNCQYSMAVFSTGERKRRPRGDRKSQEMSIHLRQTFEAAIKTELYPRSQIDIFVEVLQGKH